MKKFTKNYSKMLMTVLIALAWANVLAAQNPPSPIVIHSTEDNQTRITTLDVVGMGEVLSTTQFRALEWVSNGPEAGTVFAAHSTGGNNFGTLNIETGEFTAIETNHEFDIISLAWNRVSQTMYASTFDRRFGTIDLATGAFTQIGDLLPLPASIAICNDGNGFANTMLPPFLAASHIGRINLTTGVFTSARSNVQQAFTGNLAVDRASNTLYLTLWDGTTIQAVDKEAADLAAIAVDPPISFPSRVWAWTIIGEAEKPIDISGDFTDPTFNAFIRNLIGIPAGAFTAEDVAGITNIYFPGVNPPMTSLSGIEHLVNLEVINIPFHQVETADFSSNLKLRAIGMTENNLAVGGGIDVSMLEYLEELDISQNRVNLGGGQWVLLNQLDLTNNPRLRILNASENGLEAIDLSGNPLLESLRIGSNLLAELDLTHNPNLRTVMAGSGGSHTAVSGSFMQITELNLSHLSNLELLTISGNTMLNSVTMPVNPQALQNVTASNVRNLTDFTVNGAPNFTGFTAISSDFTTLTLTNNPILDVVNASGNPVSSIDITGSDNITRLSLFGAALTAIDVSSLANLEYLNVGNFDTTMGNNRLTVLDISNNIALHTLNADHNNIASLDITNNSALRQLGIRGNNLTELDLSHSYALFILWAEGNNLTHLDITNTRIGMQLAPVGVSFSLQNNNFADVMDVYGWWYSPNLNPGNAAAGFSNPATGQNFHFWPQQNQPAPTGAPVITTVNIPAGQVGEHFDVLFRSTGAMHQIWTAYWPAENPYPSGLTLEQNGRLHGTLLPVMEGSWNFSIITTNPRTQESDRLDLVLVVEPGVGIGIISLADAIQIFPNPVRNELNIAADSSLTITGASIFNTSGQMIQSAVNPGHQIDVSALPQGIYFIRIETDKGVVTKHFVKE